MNRKRLIRFVLLPLAAGTLCYLFSADNPLSRFPLKGNEFFRMIVQHLPDALWNFSLVSLLLLIWKNEISAASLPFILCGFFSGSIVEFAQLHEWIRGTYDPFDIFVSLTAASLALLLLRPSVNFLSEKTTTEKA